MSLLQGIRRGIRCVSYRKAQNIPTCIVKRNMGGAHSPQLYRQFPRGHTFLSIDIIMTCVWAWAWYSLFTHYQIFVGHHSYPDPKQWTDEQLGIPPDDADE